MAFCKYCGNKLEDGQSCTCEEAVNAVEVKALKEPAVTKQKPETPTKPESETPKPVVTGAKSEPEPDKSKDKRFLGYGLISASALAFIAAIVLTVILLAAIVITLLSGGYKTPLKRTIRGLNRDKAELIIDSVYPDSYIDELKETVDDNDDWSDVTDDLDSLIADVKEVCEDEYFGDDLRMSVKIVKKKEATAKERRALKKIFDKYDSDVKKAYKLKVLLTVKGSDEKEQVHFYVYSVKLKEGKWVLYGDDKTFGKFTEKFGDIYKELKSEIDEISDAYSDSTELFKAD